MSSDKNILTIDSLLDIGNVAVIVVDKQAGYVEDDSNLVKRYKTNTIDLKKAFTKLDDFIQQARRLGVEIVWTQMVENQEESAPSIALKMKLGKGVSVIRSGEKSFSIVGLQPSLNEKVIIKRRYDAFIDTDLNEYLSEKNIKTIILTGAYGSRCILATAFVGSSLGYNVFLAKDLIGNPAAFEFELKTAINIITRILGYVYESEDIIKYWQRHKHLNL